MILPDTSNISIAANGAEPRQASWPSHGCIAGAAVRACDWSQTPLGPPDSWPEALRVTVDLLLASAFPMIALWGSELIQIFNDGCGAIMGDRRPTAMGQGNRACWPEVWAFNEPNYRRVWAGETLQFHNQLIPIHRNGFLEQAYFTFSYSPVRADGAIAGILVTGFETTAEVHAQASRHDAEEDTRHMAESMPQLTWTADPDGKITDCSQRWLELTGLTREQALGDRWKQLPHPEDAGRMLHDWRNAVATGEPYDTTARIRVADGRYCWMRARALPFRDPQDAIVKWYGTVEDIDERVKTLAALRNSEERLRMAQRAALIATWDWDLATGDFTWSGDTFQIYGRPTEELSHIDRVLPAIHPEDRVPVMTAIQPAVDGSGEFHAEFRVIWPDSSVHLLDGRGKPVFSPEGKPIRVVGLNLDITRRKLAEAALLQSEKLAAVGRLATTIAHEINNPLESVTNLLYLIANSPELDPALLPYVETADAELRRASSITTQTLRFHRHSGEPAEVDLDELLSSVLALYAGRLRTSGIHIRHRAPRPVRFQCKEGEIRQVLNNLVGNAFDAMRAGGTLIVAARAATDWPTGRAGVRITVADSGEGMTPETKCRVFEAFYTTKGINGNGLGLGVSKGIVESHGGRLCVRSTSSGSHHGTTFQLFLPQTHP